MREVIDPNLWWLMDGKDKQSRKLNSLFTYYTIKERPVLSNHCLYLVEDFLNQSFSNKLELRCYLEVKHIPATYDVVNKFWEVYITKK